METSHTNIKYLIENKSQQIAEKIVELQYNANPEYWKKFGEKGKQISIRDAGYHLPFLTEAIIANDKSIFTDYVAWVKELFQGLNFPDSVMTNTLIYTRKVLLTEIPESFHSIIAEYIEAGIEQMQQPISTTTTYIDESTDLGRLARKFINELLDGDRNRASGIIFDAYKNGVSIKEIYLQVFEKSQYEIGRLWLSNQISVAKEHFCSAATQSIMSQLYPYIFSTERAGKKIITASIGGELHEIGVRMVADFFEMHGWDSYYMGANTPSSAIIKAAEENEADLIGLSIAMPYHRSQLSNVIDEVRKSDIGKHVKILIGGKALNNVNNLWENFDTDGYAPNAAKAIEVAEWLMESR